MEQIEFDIWWKEFFEQFQSRTESDEILNRLKQYINEQNNLKRQAFIDELVTVVIQKKVRWQYAADILIDFASIDQREKIKDKLIELKIIEPPYSLSADESDYLSYLIRILCGDKTEIFLPIIQKYIDYYINDVMYFSVCWTLWRTHKQYAISGWTKYFVSDVLNAKSHSIIIQAFQTEPEALKLLKAELIKQSPKIWKAFSETILAKDMTKYLSEEEKNLLFKLVKSN